MPASHMPHATCHTPHDNREEKGEEEGKAGDHALLMPTWMMSSVG